MHISTRSNINKNHFSLAFYRFVLHWLKAKRNGVQESGNVNLGAFNCGSFSRFFFLVIRSLYHALFIIVIPLVVIVLNENQLTMIASFSLLKTFSFFMPHIEQITSVKKSSRLTSSR